MKKRILSVVAVFILVCSVSGSAWGALFELDLEDVDDGLITFDPLTGLEWLDLDQTINMSYDSVTSDPYGFVQKDGFRYATGDELYELYFHTSADAADKDNPVLYLGPPNSAFYNENVCEVRNLLGLMSITAPWGNYQGEYGLFALYDENGNVEKLDIAVVGLNEIDPVAVLWITGENKSDYGLDPISLTDERAFYGSYLVRDASAVPLPGAFFFLASGCVALLGAKRRFRKQ